MMQPIVLSQASDVGRQLSGQTEFNLSFDDFPVDFVESFFSSPSVDCNEFVEDLDLDTFSKFLDHEHNDRVLPSPPSSISTEPLCDNDQMYQMISELIHEENPTQQQQSTSIYSVSRKRSAVSDDLDYYHSSSLSPRRRKTHHTHLFVDEEDSISTSNSSYRSSGDDSLKGKSLGSQRKRLSNREAAHRYRQKVKMRADSMNDDLNESYRSMYRAKHAYEKAAEALRLLQRVVTDLTAAN